MSSANLPLDLLQALSDRFAGMPTNGHTAADFPEPLGGLWRLCDITARNDWPDAVRIWIGNDQDRWKLFDLISQSTPGAPPPPPPRDKWQRYTLADAFRPRPALTFIVADTIVTPSLVVVYGAPGVLKSLLVADLCICVASGQPWLPPDDSSRPDTTKHTVQTPALWCDFDNGSRRTHERFEALARARTLTAGVPLTYVSMPDPWLNLTEDQAVTDMEERIKQLGAGLVVIDNLGVVSGNADENTAEMIGVMSSLRRIAESTGACVIVIHHQRKGNGSANSTRAGESLRGHSSIEAALDLALLVMRDKQADSITIRSTKSRDVDVLPFGAQFEYTHRPGRKELETAHFLGVVVDSPTSATAIEDAILAVLTAQGKVNRTPLANEVSRRTGAKNPVVLAAIDNLNLLGKIKMTPGKHNAQQYQLNQQP